MTNLLTVVAVLAIGQSILGAKLPDNYPLCKRKDPNIDMCLTKALQFVLTELPKGIPHLGVLSMDPLEVTSADISQGQGPISISLKFRNLVVHGLTKAIIQKIHVDLDNYDMGVTGTEPHLLLEADYEMDGRILVVPVQGKGRCNITFTDLVSSLHLTGKGVKKGPDTFYNVENLAVNITGLGLMQANFENLFNGDKTLGPTLNTLLNDNWKDLWAELRPSFEGTFGAVFKEVSNRLFGKVPYKDIFID